MSVELHEAIGRSLEKCRRSAKMSRLELARRVGVSALRVAGYELARTELEATMLLRVCAATGVSVDVFWDHVTVFMGAAEGAMVGRPPAQVRAARSATA